MPSNKKANEGIIMIYGFTARDNDLGGYSIKNALDGIRAWYVFAKTDATAAKVYANGNAVATEGASLPGGWYMAGMVMLPKGEHVIDVEADAAIERVMIADTEIEADTEDGLTRAWENRAGQPTFEQDRVSYTGKDLKLLRRHGFVMHQLKDSQAMAAPSGMPLQRFRCHPLLYRSADRSQPDTYPRSRPLSPGHSDHR